MANENAIVFGGAGFIGCHFLKRLARLKHYDRLYSVDIAAPRFTTDGVQYVNFDIRERIPPQLLTNICRFASDVDSTQMLFTSTMMVYGPTEAPKDEDALLEPVNAYGRSKILAEGIHRLWQLERPEKRRLTIVRPGVIYGLAERGNFTRLARALRQRRFVYPGRVDTIKACGYIDDLVSSMVEMQKRNEGIVLYNFCHPQRYTSKEICAAFCKVAGYPEPRIIVPFWLLGLVAAAFEGVARLGFKTEINRARVRKLYQSTNMIPRRLPDMGFRYQYDLIAGLTHWKQSSRVTDFD
jgi:GlcNAc-P-P-Und epimerase